MIVAALIATSDGDFVTHFIDTCKLKQTIQHDDILNRAIEKAIASERKYARCDDYVLVRINKDKSYATKPPCYVDEYIELYPY